MRLMFSVLMIILGIIPDLRHHAEQNTRNRFLSKINSQITVPHTNRHRATRLPTEFQISDGYSICEARLTNTEAPTTFECNGPPWPEHCGDPERGNQS